MDNYIQDNEIQIEIPENLIAPDCLGTVVSATLLLDLSDLEQVNTALHNGRRTAVSRLERTKAFHKRISANIDINNIDSAIDKVERCKPKTLYPLKLLTSEIESLRYCLEHSKGSKSKERRKLIDMLDSCLD